MMKGLKGLKKIVGELEKASQALRQSKSIDAHNRGVSDEAMKYNFMVLDKMEE